MLSKEIEELRERLNRMLDSSDCGYREILRVSQELDKLIVKYYGRVETQAASV